VTERLACDYRPKNRADAEAYIDWCREVFEPEDFEEIRARLRLSEKRRRRPSVTALIKRARRAGERGPVRVALPDGTVITSEREGSVAAMTQDDAETPETLRKLIQ
jgi:hypothetical protein